MTPIQTLTLENVDNTVRGVGSIDLSTRGASIINDAGGAIVADATGMQSPTLSVGGNNVTVTNSGILQSNPGSTLYVNSSYLTNYITSTQTLKGGTYRIFSTATKHGVLQLKPLGRNGGEIINNAATILLDGPNSDFVDDGFQDVLSAFTNNQDTGSFAIDNGRDFQSPVGKVFTNGGVVVVGGGSKFSSGGYQQAGGSSEVNGNLISTAEFTGGTLLGRGTLRGQVTMAGVIAPGRLGKHPVGPLHTENVAGTLRIIGDYSQTGGTLELDLGGRTAGKSFGFLRVSGKAKLAGTLHVKSLFGFKPKSGDKFTFLVANKVSGTFAQPLARCPDCIQTGCFEPVYGETTVTLVFHDRNSRQCQRP